GVTLGAPLGLERADARREGGGAKRSRADGGDGDGQTERHQSGQSDWQRGLGASKGVSRTHHTTRRQKQHTQFVVHTRNRCVACWRCASAPEAEGFGWALRLRSGLRRWSPTGHTSRSSKACKP